MSKTYPIKSTERLERMQDMLDNGVYLHKANRWRRPNKRDALLFRVGIHSLVRITDLLTLRVQDVLNGEGFREHWILEEQKTGKTKRVKLDEKTQARIREYIQHPPAPAKEALQPSSYFFYSNRSVDKPIDRHQAYRRLVPVAEEVGIHGFGIHSLRKTLPYHVYKQTKDIVLCQRMLNHQEPKTTLAYLGIEQEEVDAAVEEYAL